jgi:hypothetical protein
VPASPNNIQLLDRHAGDALVGAVLEDQLVEAHVDQWYATWRPIYDEIRATKPHKDWPESGGWDWSQKLAKSAGFAAYRGFAVQCEGQLQGMMQVLIEHPNYPALDAAAKGKPLVYVDYLETAPWNQAWHPKKRFGGVGTVLLMEAVELSKNEEFGGRVGLHSLPRSEAFYRNRGMHDYGPDKRHSHQLRYFEFTVDSLAKLSTEE